MLFELPEFRCKYLSECSCVYLRGKTFDSFHQILTWLPNSSKKGLVSIIGKYCLQNSTHPIMAASLGCLSLFWFSGISFFLPTCRGFFFPAQTLNKPEQFFSLRASSHSPVSYKLEGKKSPRVNYLGVPSWVDGELECMQDSFSQLPHVSLPSLGSRKVGKNNN